jgi:hypothetical protein
MPDPRGAKRLVKIGCKVRFKLTKIRVPVIVKDYDDFVPGTRYPKMEERKVWLVSIEMPRELMDDIKEGSIDLAGQTIDLKDLEDSYDDDLQKEDSDGTEDGGDMQQQTPGMADLGAPAPLGAPPAPAA